MIRITFDPARDLAEADLDGDAADFGAALQAAALAICKAAGIMERGVTVELATTDTEGDWQTATALPASLRPANATTTLENWIWQAAHCACWFDDEGWEWLYNDDYTESVGIRLADAMAND